MDIAEFYPMAEELFSPEEAAVASAMPLRSSPAETIAGEMGRELKEVERILERMADKGLCISFTKDGKRHYAATPFVPGIFEFQFMRGTSTERVRKLARLIHNYKEAVDKVKKPQPTVFPASRVITVEETIQPGTKIHTYDQVSSYIEKLDPIAVTTCYCRHAGKLLDEKSDCGKPDDVCMMFGTTAQYLIERGMGRKVTKDEAKQTLEKAEEAGLVHSSLNAQEIDFICNCCPCHCMILKTALKMPKPGRFLFSSFQPQFNADLCLNCENCIERCPAGALTASQGVPNLDIDRCFGCGVCASGCPAEAIEMVKRIEAPEPPLDRKALRMASQSR